MSTTNSRNRRTSVSSTTSSRSSWRVPSAKQPPRTALSVVFADATPARSPSNHSAFTLLESKYASTSPSPSSAITSSPVRTSPTDTIARSMTNATLPDSASALSVKGIPEQGEVQVIDIPNVDSTANVALIGAPPSTHQEQGSAASSLNATKSSSGWFRRGRQPTQRRISLTTDTQPTLPAVPTTSPNTQPSEIDSLKKELTIVAPATTLSPPNVADKPHVTQSMDSQPTSSSNIGGSKDSRPAPVSRGWFGSSGRSKGTQIHNNAKSLADPLPKQDTPSVSAVAPTVTNSSTTMSTINPETDTRNVLSDSQVQMSSKSQSTSSKGWFSRPKPSASGPASSTSNATSTSQAPPIQPPSAREEPPTLSLPSNTSSQAIAIKVTDPTPPLEQTNVAVSASPSRSSWLRSTLFSSTSNDISGGLDTVISHNTQGGIGSSSSPATPSSVSFPLPHSPSSTSLVDDSMVATITPQTFAQGTRPNGPSTWFSSGTKRASIAPSVDSVVPSLPPSRSHSPARLSVIPIQNPSTTSLNSSSARYTLSLPVLGRTKLRVGDIIRDNGSINSASPVTLSSAANLSAMTSNVSRNTVPEITEVINIPSVMADAVNPTTVDTSWWSYLGWSTAPGPQEQTLNPPSLSTHDSVPSSSSSVDEQRKIQHSEETRAPENQVVITETTSWFGFWGWNGQTQPPPKTEAELIKEEALARENISTVTPTLSPADTASPRVELSHNPISDDAIDNRASWTSFFSLRAAHGAKRIPLEEEVMDLDGDPEVPAGTSSNSAPSSARIGGKMSKSNDAITTHASSSQPRSSSAGPSRKGQAAPPLTDSDSLRRKAVGNKRSSSTTSSRRSAPPPVSKAPNMVLPTFEDTFYTLPRALPPYQRPTRLNKVGRLVGDVLGLGGSSENIRKDMKEWQQRAGIHVPTSYEKLRAARDVGRDLPRSGEVLGIKDIGNIKECKRVAIIGVHGWFPGTIMRTLLGEPTGTSPKFASMMEAAVLEFMEEQGVTLEKVTSIPLEGEGTIDQRVERLYQNLIANKEWVEDLHEADAVFVATHSQGSVVSTHLLDKLIADGHLRTTKNWEIVKHAPDPIDGGINVDPSAIRPPQKVCCLALCGIHLGPLLYLGTSSLVNPYLQYFESAAAKELFEFQDTESAVSKKYISALESVLDHGTKFVYVASLDDQVVPIYSGIFTAAHHPRILRALYIDGDAYSSSDFLSNLLVLLLRLRNAGIDDGGLITHLSEATAGSLSGIGHSTAYLDSGAYRLAVKFLFETSDALGGDPKLEFEPFTAKASRNDYEIPWALRGLVSDPRCQELFGKELAELRAAFDNWQPRTSALRDVRRKLEPIRGRRSRFAPDPFAPNPFSLSLPSPSAISPVTPNSTH